MLRKLVITLLSGTLCLLVTSSALAVKYNEAPMLKTMVAAGELPPVEERLPEVPARCMDVAWENIDLEIGKYGGTLRYTDTSAIGQQWHMFHENLLSIPEIRVDYDTMTGNILESFEVDGDGRVFTFHMRKGLKWSDGYPATTEDIRFRWEDILLNKKLTGSVHGYFRAGGEVMELEIIDDYTYRIRFKEPYGGFLTYMASDFIWFDTFMSPAHYLKAWHASYTPIDKLEAEIKKEGFGKGEWWRLFSLRTSKRPKPDDELQVPTFSPWVQMEKGTTKVVWERNPYYYKVDPAGNQLPYIDRIEQTIVQNVDAVTMKILAGEVDLLRQAGKAAPLLLEYADEAGYRVILDYGENAGTNTIYFNQTHLDPVWRQVVRDVRFRKAVSYAINRAPIIEVTRLGYAVPPTLIPSEYDPEKANRLLDEMGLDKRDKEGYRLGPDGKRFVIPFEYGLHPLWPPAFELVTEDLADVGLKVTTKKLEWGILDESLKANEVKATMLWYHYGLWPLGMADWAPRGCPLGNLHASAWCPLWREWLGSDGEEGEEPPVEIKRLDDLYQLMMRTTDQKVMDEVWAEVRSLWYENVFYIPMMEGIGNAYIVSKKMGNIPHSGMTIAVNMSVEQYFFKE